MTATTTISKRPTSGSKLPSVCWIDRAKQWSCKIGYNMSSNGRSRAYQYIKEEKSELGEHKAQQQAIKIRDEWDQIVIDWPKHQQTLQRIATHIDWSATVWTTTKFISQLVAAAKGDPILEEVKALSERSIRSEVYRLVETYPVIVKQTVNPLGEVVKPSPITLKMAVDLWLAAKRKQVGLSGGMGIKANTYNDYQTQILLAMKPLDSSMSISDIGRDNLKNLVHHWMALPQGISLRTAVGYCKLFKQFLNWLADEEFEWTLPKKVENLFRFKKFNKKSIPNYEESLPKIKRILATAPDRTRLYVMLALNLGAYQVDISAIMRSEMIQKNGDHFIWRQREKTSNQEGYEVLHLLWPETVALINQFKSIQENGLLITNNNGEPLVVSAVDEIKKDGITSAYKRVISKIRKEDMKAEVPEKFSFMFKQFRKIGATAIKRIADQDTTRMYLGQVIPGVLSQYAQDDFEKVTAALRAWHDELKAKSTFPA